MSRFFSLLSTHVEGGRDTHYLNVLLPDRALSIGWAAVNPLHKSPEELGSAVERHYASMNTWNRGNAKQSLGYFVQLRIGDVVFVRGDGRIVDTVIITSRPYYDDQGHYSDDYRLKVGFTPLFAEPSGILMSNIPEPLHHEFIFDEGGRSKAMKLLNDAQARQLLGLILSR